MFINKMENLLVVAGLAVILVRIVRTGYFFQLVQLTATLRTAETSLVKRLIIEVILFMSEWLRYFTIVIKLRSREHLLKVLVLNDSPRLGIYQVTSFVYGVTIFIDDFATCVLQHKRIAFLISVYFAQNVILVKSAQISSRRHIDLLSDEVTEQSVRHPNRFICFRQLRRYHRISFYLLPLKL